MSNIRKYAMYASLGLATVGFAAAGMGKLAGVEQMHMSFAAMGLPIWFGYFIGACELAGAIGIWIKKLSAKAATGLSLIMAGAIYFHVVYDAVANALPAVILALFLINIIVNRRREVTI